MISSGASWLPKRETHGNPTSSANFSTNADFPIPGSPQINTGLTVGFDVEAELRCAKTRHWIKQEEKRVERMSRDYDDEDIEEDDDSDEIEDEESVSLMDIFRKAVEMVKQEKE